MALWVLSCSPYGWVEGPLLTLGLVPPSFCLSSLPTNLIRDNLFLYKERSWLLTKLESCGKIGIGRAPSRPRWMAKALHIPCPVVVCLQRPCSHLPMPSEALL